MKKIIIILLIVTTVLIIGGVTYMLLSGSSTPKQPKAETPAVKHETSANKDAVEYSPSESGFVTNIKNSTKYLKMKVALEIKDEKSKEHFAKQQAKIKDIIINVLRSKTESELFADDAQENLKSVIKSALTEKLELKDLLDVYIDEFVIQ